MCVRMQGVLGLVIVSVALAGCERAADVSSPKIFQHEDFSFQYPRNWTLTEEDLGDGVHHVTVESPGAAVFFVQRLPEGAAAGLDLKEYAQRLGVEASSRMPLGEMTQGELRAVRYTRKTDGVVLEGVQEEFVIEAFGQQVPHTRAVFRYPVDGPRLLITCQIAQEDLSRARPGCDLALDSVAFGQGISRQGEE